MGTDDQKLKEYRQGSAAVALRLAGASFAEVADALGLASAAVARTMVETELANRSHDPAAREVLRTEASARLERLLRSVWQKATNPEHIEHLPAVKAAQSIVDRLIRLHGLDAPSEVVVHSPTTAEIDAWVARMMGSQVEEMMGMEDDVIDVEAVDHALNPAPAGG